MYVRNKHSPGLGYATSRFGQWEALEAEAKNLAAAGKHAEANLKLAEAARLKREYDEKMATQRSREALVGTVATVGTQLTSQLLAQQAALKQSKLDSKARIAEAGRPQVIQQGGGGGGGEGLSSGAIVGLVVGGIAVLGVVLVLATKK